MTAAYDWIGQFPAGPLPIRIACKRMSSPCGEAAALDLYAKRYRPADVLYERFAEPEARCDAIIYNDNFAQPRLDIRPSGWLA